MLFDILINGGIIITCENDYRPFIGSIGIQDKRIVYVGEEILSPDLGKEFIDATGKIVMPGLINGHCHGDMTLGRGLLDNLTLFEQNEKMAPYSWLYKYISDKDRYYSRQLTYLEAIRSGTTFLMENMYWSLGLDSVKAMAKTGLKGALAEDIRVNFYNPEEFLPDEYWDSFIESCKNYSILPVFGTISEEDFDEKLLFKITEKVKQYGILSTQHLAETPWRVQKISQKFSARPVEYLNRINALHPALIGSHAVYIEEDEIEMMKENNVKVVNTPLCEMKIADGIAPIPKFLKMGVPVGLGTDGAMWNNSNDMFREMKGIVLLHTINSGIRTLSERDALNMATITGAKVFGLDQEIGSIRVGKLADIILIDAAKPHFCPLRIKNHENVASSVVFNATGQDVTDSIINGRIVMRDKKILTIDEQKIMRKVEKISEEIAKKIPKNAFKMEVGGQA